MTPGIHSMSAEQYHDAAGVSNSMLEWLRPPKTAAHFKARYIDKVIEDKETPAVRMGTLEHRILLEPDTMDGAFWIKPAGLKFSTTSGKEWQKEHADRPVLTVDEAISANGMRDAIWTHPTASKILKSSDFERAAFAEEKGLLLKSKFDALPTSGNVIGDLKTCESADLDSVEKSISQYFYFCQGPYYLKVANLLGLERELFILIFVEKHPPYFVACYSLTDDVMQAGRMMIERNLRVLRNCYDTNQWPGYPTGVTACGLPPYAMKRIEEIA